MSTTAVKLIALACEGAQACTATMSGATTSDVLSV
jgi:hypothetical protein